MTRAYIAGPMRGRPLYNFRAFFKAAMRLRNEFGWDVVNPAEMDMARGFDPSKDLDDQDVPFDMETVLRDDFREILECDAIVMLPGWETSRGARIERALAHYAGIEILEFDPDGAGGPVRSPLDQVDPEIRFQLRGEGKGSVPRLWESLPGVKGIRLQLDHLGHDWAGVKVDVVDWETEERLYDFGVVVVDEHSRQALIKLDAEVELDGEEAA